MNSTPECVTKTPEIEAREKLAAIFSDAEQRSDNSKVNPELGKTAFDVIILKRISLITRRLIFVNRCLVKMRSLPILLRSVKEIGNMLADLRKTKANEVQ